MSLEFLSSPLIIKIIRFGLVGCTGVIVDFGITFLLKEKLKINKYLASSIGFCVAATNNYILNRIWTFSSADPNIMVQYSKFIIIASVGVLLSNGIVWLLHERFKFNFYIAKGLSIIIVMSWNFIVNNLYTFQ
ncbi:MAG TPA: GtrA family protein [Cyclobacteriaceae bacterium]